MRLARRTQCPECSKTYGIQTVGYVGDRPILHCQFCHWTPEASQELIRRYFIAHTYEELQQIIQRL